VRSLFTLAGLLVVMVVVLVLATRESRQDLDAVRSVTLGTQSDAEARPFDAEAATALARRLVELAEWPQPPHDELRDAAARAAGWAAGLAPGTSGYHMAVNLRGAADELLAASESLDDPHRAKARRLLGQADAAPGRATGAPPGPIGGIRDRIQDLQQSHQEQLQETEQEHH
jgi:hypothetical protein